jgi:hypothetical protein
MTVEERFVIPTTVVIPTIGGNLLLNYGLYYNFLGKILRGPSFVGMTVEDRFVIPTTVVIPTLGGNLLRNYGLYFKILGKNYEGPPLSR